MNSQTYSSQSTYSPECVEEEFSEVHGSNLSLSAPPQHV
jgi:hypothetical protein